MPALCKRTPSFLWLYPASYLLFRYDLLSTVGSTQSCSLFPHTRVEVLLSWRCLEEVGFVAAVKDACGMESPRCRSQVSRLSTLLSFSAAFVIFYIFVRRMSTIVVCVPWLVLDRGLMHIQRRWAASPAGRPMLPPAQATSEWCRPRDCTEMATGSVAGPWPGWGKQPGVSRSNHRNWRRLRRRRCQCCRCCCHDHDGGCTSCRSCRRRSRYRSCCRSRHCCR
jgi:hypothetical protein